MKKTIIAAAVAASVAAPAAFAEVTVYGKMHYALVDTDSNGTKTEDYNNNATRWGLKGSEDLGNGMKAFFKNEFGMNTIDGGTESARDAYVGISGDFGKLTAGRMSAPTKGMLYGIGNVQVADINHGEAGDFAGAFTSKGHRVSNALAYSNSFGGVNVTAAITGDQAGNGTDFSENTSFSIDTTVAGVKVGYATLNYGSGQGSDVDIFGAKMSMDALTIGLAYEDVDSTNDTTGVSLSYKMGNNSFNVAYAETDVDAGSATDHDTTVVSLQHSLSKRTSVYVGYSEVDSNTAANDIDSTSVGLIHTF
jgi:predicted porin